MRMAVSLRTLIERSASPYESDCLGVQQGRMPNVTIRQIGRSAVLSLTLAAVVCAFAEQRVAATLAQTLESFTRPLLFTYGSWEKLTSVYGGALVVRAPDGRGGGGQNLPVPTDLRSKSTQSPAVIVTIGPGHRARRMKVMLRDDRGGAAIWAFDLVDVARGRQMLLTPVDIAALDFPNETEGKALDLSRVHQVHVQGDWSGEAFDLAIEELGLVELSSEMLAVRKRRQDEVMTARRHAESDKLSARTSIRHVDTSPVITHVGLVDRDILGVTIADGVHIPGKAIPYDARPGDQIVFSDSQVLVDVEGEIRREGARRTLMRSGSPVGYVAGGRNGQFFLWPFESRTGDRLELRTVDDVDSYRVVSADDPVFTKAVRPLSVYRKTKPSNRVYPREQQTLRHTIYLKLPAPLVDGKIYTIDFPGLNVEKRSVRFAFNDKVVRSEAIHTQQVGYRPDDPYKRAFLSIWLGTGGGHALDRFATFQLIDSSGRAVHRGKIERVLAVDGKERIRGSDNLSRTAVYAMDFSGFQQPGGYHVHVPGLGISHPMVIDADVWRGAFEKSMHGFLAQRSGIALGPPATEFVRPRSLHPADGVRVFRSTAQWKPAKSTDDWFKGLIDGRTSELMPNAWGGYHDAGDFDRSSFHMWASYEQLELLELFPDYFRHQKLRLPANESSDALPDLLNEVLWNMECWRRLQEPDGGVSGGIESSSHPRPGENSVTDSLVLMAYSPDVESTYLFAAVAARTARVANDYDKALARTYADSALRAWDWSEARRAAANLDDETTERMNDVRNTAAVDLLALTGQKRFDLAFQQTTKLRSTEFLIVQQGAAFMYSRLPEGLGADDLKTLAKRRLLDQADKALAYGDGNAFGLTSEVQEMPLIGSVGAFTTPGMRSRILPRAHYLTGDSKYLAGAIRACNFSLGANPDNMTMTTGVGIAAPIAPLHLDSRLSGQPPPEGLTVFGAYDSASLPSFADSSEWVHKWLLPNMMVPSSRTWPPAEAYVDFFLWPLMNEHTIAQTMGPTGYYWGYLAARR